DMGPKLCESRLFKTLKTIEGGKFKPVYSCLNEVFEGLTKLDIDERMSVHEACEKVQSIKPLLPKIGEGWKCPSIEDIVKAQVAKYGGNSGYIQGVIGKHKCGSECISADYSDHSGLRHFSDKHKGDSGCIVDNCFAGWEKPLFHPSSRETSSRESHYFDNGERGHFSSSPNSFISSKYEKPPREKMLH
ncbi:hypothetical protein ADUPG1_004916, partial [Aduncisulcus paluster]